MYKFKLSFIISFILFSLFLGCKQEKEHENDKPLARVHDKYLYESDLKQLLPSNISQEDSVTLTKNYINDWIKKQLMLQKAEENLPTESKNIEKQIEDYRSSLLIFKYRQELIKQKIDTVITQQEIESYYNEYSANFILNHNIVKALYLKISKESPEINNVKKWYKSDNAEDLTKLEDYCYQYATKFDNFNNEWISFSNLLSELPLKIDDEERYLRYNKYIETEDSLFNYFVKINDFALRSSIQPIEYAKPKIKTIILNKRKFSFIEELENNIYNNALNRNEFIIY
ncbi:MAG: peptidyl-prolyl cis-trans isomerase [Bacteroidota bacterium]|nr:peptidyl-prolyl cis-trans isomerase [Bacteroidota bacterium]